MDCRANGGHHDAGGQSACAREPEKAATGADGDDDERDLDPFHEHDLERGQAADPVEPMRLSPPGFAQFARLPREGGVLVVQGDDSDRAQDRLAQPAQAEQEREHADNELQAANGNDAHQRPEDGDDQRKRDESGRGAGERRAPATRKSDSQHDGQRLDRLNERGGERGARDRNDRRQVRHCESVRS